MTYEQALKILNFSGNLSRKEYSEIAGNMLNTFTRQTPLRFKCAARTLLKGA